MKHKISSYGVNVIEILDISSADVGLIYLAEQIIDNDSTNHNVGNSLNQPISARDRDYRHD